MKLFYPLLLFAFVLLRPQVNLANQPIECQISVTGSQTGICQGQPFVLMSRVDDKIGEIAGQLWQTDGKLLSDPKNNFVSFDTSIPGSYSVIYKAWNIEGQEALCELEIEVIPLPNIEIVENFGFFQRILFKKPMPRFSIFPSENHTFQWFFNDHEISGASQNKFKPRKPGKYFVKSTNQQGCSAYSKIISVE